MRLKIHLSSEKGKLHIPFNYNHIISAIIYNKIADLELAKKIHDSKSYKYFTFSQLKINNFKLLENGFLSKNGKISFIISSPNENLIKNLVNGFLDGLTVDFMNEKLTVEKIELLRELDSNNKLNVKTLSPVIARTKKEVDGKMKIWDLSPGDHFFKNLENNLISKYLDYNNLEETDKKIKISSEMRNVKGKRISLKNGNVTTFHRAYMMDLILEGDFDLIKFGYDAGIGEKCGLGFGLIK